MTTGESIRAARKRAKMTQADLAKKLNVPYQSIGQWERGTRKPKYETLKRIAEALSIPITNLLKTSQGDFAFGSIIEYASELDHLQFQQLIEELVSIEIDKTKSHIIDKSLLSQYITSPESSVMRNLKKVMAQLNPEGQQTALERVKELTEIPKYKIGYRDVKKE